MKIFSYLKLIKNIFTNWLDYIKIYNYFFLYFDNIIFYYFLKKPYKYKN